MIWRWCESLLAKSANWVTTKEPTNGNGASNAAEGTDEWELCKQCCSRHEDDQELTL